MRLLFGFGCSDLRFEIGIGLGVGWVGCSVVRLLGSVCSCCLGFAFRYFRDLLGLVCICCLGFAFRCFGDLSIGLVRFGSVPVWFALVLFCLGSVSVFGCSVFSLEWVGLLGFGCSFSFVYIYYLERFDSKCY